MTPLQPMKKLKRTIAKYLRIIAEILEPTTLGYYESYPEVNAHVKLNNDELPTISGTKQKQRF